MTTKPLYPGIRPALDLNFARTKTLDSRITFSRASTATFVGANGLVQTAASGAARFDHNPATGESLGLLVEEARTNNIVPSNPSSAGWAPTPLSNYPATSGITFNQANTLTGGNTAASFNSGSSQLNYGAGTINSGTTLSFYVTGVTATVTLNMAIPSTGGGSIVISSSYGITLSSNGGWLANGTINNVGKGWYRVSATINATSGNCQFNIVGGNSGVLLDLFQLEAGSFPTSYIPTTTATVTRAADVASMTGTNFSSWFNASSGSFLFAQKTPTTLQTSPLTALYLITAGIGSTLNGYWITNLVIPADAAGSNAWSTTGAWLTTGLTANEFAKLAFGYTNGSAAAVKNGVVQETNTENLAAVVPTTLSLAPGATATIARLTYYPVRLPDAQLQALTAT
jgi:hypothetical protein